MAKYSNTKAKINEKVTTNGRQGVTGSVLNDVLQTMVDSLGADYQFGGLVQPGSSFTAGEQPVVFLATTPGPYTNFGGLIVADGEVALLVWSGSAWSKQTPDIATRTEVGQLGQEVNDTISVETQAGYNAVSLPHKLKAGTVIYDFSGLERFYFVGERSNYDLYPTDHELTKAELPYTLPADIVKVTANTAATLTIRSGLDARIKRTENEIAELQIGLSGIEEDVSDIKSSLDDEVFGYSETVELQPSYEKVNLSRTYKAGEIIYSFSGVNSFYFVKKGTNYEFIPDGELHQSDLPYTLTDDVDRVCNYRGGTLTFSTKSIESRVAKLENDFSEVAEKTATVRKQINILTTDTQVEILTKMLLAYSQKNTDVFWEHGTYTFDSIYIYMRDTLGWTWRLGLPLGDGCRYYFNDSIIISNAPQEPYSISRMLFDSAKDGTYDVNSYELYDGHLINNGGTYVIHDEGNSQTPFYQHKYKNLILEYNDDGVGITYPFGCGVGYNTAIYFDAVYFKSSRNACAAIHSVNNHDTPVNFTLSVKDCYFSGASFGMTGFDKTQDNLLLYYCGNSSTSDTDADFTEMVKFNNEIRS